MTEVIRAELYRMYTLRSWRLALPAAALICLLAGLADTGAWTFLVGTMVFLLGVVGGAQHYQHRTAILLFLARPKRLTVLAGQAVAYGLVGGAFAGLTGVGALANGDFAQYAFTGIAAALMTVFAVANAAILRRPVWIIIGYGLWFVIVELLIFQGEFPGPFMGYLAVMISEPMKLLALVFWTVVSLAVAVRAIARDVTGSE
jgi:hypothetical protein